MGTVIDYAWGRPAPAILQKAGASGVARYLSWLPNGKVIDREEYSALRGAGLAVILVWEYDARDWAGGNLAADRHAAEAIRQARALGHPPGAGIYGAADWDMTSTQWTSAARSYAETFRNRITAAGYRPGVYGPSDVLGWCKGLGYALFWQAGMSTAWSGGRNATPWPGAHLRQRYPIRVDGVACDINDILQADYGQPEDNDDMANFSDRDREILIEGASLTSRMAKGFATLDDGVTVNQLYRMIESLHQRPAATPVAITDEQAADIGRAAGATAAAVLVDQVNSRIEALEQQVRALTEARRAASHAEGEALAS